MSDTILSVSAPTEGSLVRLVIGGKFEKEDLEKLKTWSEEVSRAIADTHAKTGTLAHVLIDITGLKGYSDPEALLILADLMKKDAPHVSKTATFGGSFLLEMAQDVIKAFARRDNLKNFKTETEALAWLAS